MDRPMANLGFRMMALGFGLRDLFSPPTETLKECKITAGDHILDYGCGPGGYTIAAAQMVGRHGTVHAVDVHPLAIETVKRRAARHRLDNIGTRQSDCETGLDDESTDVVLFYDILHALSDPARNLAEFHRVLKAGGRLSVSDHHLLEAEITTRITGTGLFDLVEKGEHTFSFQKR